MEKHSSSSACPVWEYWPDGTVWLDIPYVFDKDGNRKAVGRHIHSFQDYGYRVMRCKHCGLVRRDVG